MVYEQLLEFIDALSTSKFTECTYEADGIKLYLKREETVARTQEIQTVPTEPVQCESVKDETVKDIVSPIVGVFYAAPSPDADPFVKVGDRVEKGQVIGIVEAMKLMNEIQSDISGVVTHIYAENGDGVEYGQPLIGVRE